MPKLHKNPCLSTDTLTHVSFMDVPMLLIWVPIQITSVALMDTLECRSIGIWPSLEKQQ